MYALLPKEYDEITLSPPAKPTVITCKLKGATVRVITLTYEGATENVEKIVLS